MSPPPSHTLPHPLPVTPLSSSPHGSTNVGRGLSGLHQSGPALYVKLCSPPIRSRVVLRALEFPAGGGCSVWFIPVYSCLLCVAGDLTARTPTVARVHAHTQARTHTKHRRARASCLWQLSRHIGTHRQAEMRAEANECWGGRKLQFSRVDSRYWESIWNTNNYRKNEEVFSGYVLSPTGVFLQRRFITTFIWRILRCLTTASNRNYLSDAALKFITIILCLPEVGIVRTVLEPDFICDTVWQVKARLSG